MPVLTLNAAVQKCMEKNTAHDWASTHDATVADTTDYDYGVFDQYYKPTDTWYLVRFGMIFDLASLPAAAKVTSAKLSIYVSSKTDDLGAGFAASLFTPASATAIVAEDYDQFGATATNTVSCASLTTSAKNDWTLNATGLATLTSGAKAKFMLRSSLDISNTDRGEAATAYNTIGTSPTASNNQLIITYTLPSSMFFLLKRK